MRHIVKTTLLLGLSASLAACVAPVARQYDADAWYISPLAYQQYSCAQLSGEAYRIRARAAQLFEPARRGSVIAAVEYTRIRGENDALYQAAASKRCPIATAETRTTQPQ